MNAGHLLHRYGHHLERIALPQILFGGEGEFCDILRCLQIIGMDPGSIEFALVEANIFIGMRNRPF